LNIILLTAKSHVPIILAGTKLDMIEDENTLKGLSQMNQKPVSTAEGERMAVCSIYTLY
jgi:hypothetical protein